MRYWLLCLVRALDRAEEPHRPEAWGEALCRKQLMDLHKAVITARPSWQATLSIF